jgi:hypothetical protein
LFQLPGESFDAEVFEEAQPRVQTLRAVSAEIPAMIYDSLSQEFFTRKSVKTPLKLTDVDVLF